MRPVHPGEILREELDVLEMSANSLAAALGVPGNRIAAILNGQRGITADMALRLSRYLGTTADFWLNLQKSYELRLAEREAGKQIEATALPFELLVPNKKTIKAMKQARRGKLEIVTLDELQAAIDAED